ncbi:MAG: hypothetical protein EOM02_00120 [Synergistales bacterium]|nr:patatin-like phospholipase family protein [Dethiosulfovibrio sp.]NCC95225.1 hypothetical protein [Synergistales bacterium]
MVRSAKFLLCIAFILFSSVASFAQGAVVLALSGGGMKGLAHIGVLKVLEERGIPIAGIVGTSMGAIMGGLAASGYSADELRDVVSTVNMAAVILGQDDTLLPQSDTKNVSPLMPRRDMNSKWEVVGPKGPLSGIGAHDLFMRLTSRVSVSQFDDLPIPFAAVATDLMTGEKVVIRQGSLASAIRASMSIPGVFEPWPIDGRLLVDGGLVSNMPVRTAKKLFPGYPVVAVNVSSGLRSPDQIRTMPEVIDQTITILTSQNVMQEQSEADVIIRPAVESIATLGSVKVDAIIKLGEDAARLQLDRIVRVASSAPPVMERKPQPVRLVRGIEVEGVPEDFANRIKNSYGHWVGKPVSPEEILRATETIRFREDVRTVDYILARSGDEVDVILKIQREPAYRFALDGYASNMLGGSWLGVRGTMMDLGIDGNYLTVDALLGDDWAAKLDYHFGVEKNFYKFSAHMARLSLSPRNAPYSKWDFRSFSVTRGIASKTGRMSAGLMLSDLDGDGVNLDTWGPVFQWDCEGLVKGSREVDSMLHVGAWYPDEGREIVARVDGAVSTVLSHSWRAYIRGGFFEGNDSSRYPGQAAYLGSREELYSLSEYPIKGERFAWWRIGITHRLNESGGTPLDAELFGGQGYVWDDGGSQIDDPWEIGVSLTVPSNLIKARILAVYDDSRDWTFGFTIGDPLWSVRHNFP